MIYLDGLCYAGWEVNYYALPATDIVAVFDSVTLGATKINVSLEKAVGSTFMYPTLTILLHIELVLNPVPFIVT